MVRRMALVLMCLILTWGGTACAPQLVGPTPGAGYRFSLEVSEPTIWLVSGILVGDVRDLTQSTELLVRVQDAQGRPVDGVPVTFEVEPDWVGRIALAPSQTSTRNGLARAIVSDPKTTGVVRVMVRVDAMTAQARLTVQRFAGGSNSGVQ